MGFLKTIIKNINYYKSGIIAVIALYLITMVGQSLLGWLRYTQAESPIGVSRLVAVLVEDSLVDSLKGDLDRYTKTYMSTRVDNAVPLVISVHKDYTAHDIQNILENLYFEGLVGKSSRLEGMVAIGNVPLPVVYDQDVGYESVFPYVDFEDSAYMWSPVKKRFESTKHIQKPRAEIWHGLMTWGSNPNVYHAFFAKLKNYYNNPTDFVDKRLWFDDLTELKAAIEPDKVRHYVQKGIFAEDLNYRRYTPLLFSLLNSVYDDRVKGVIDGLSNIKPLPLEGNESDNFTTGLNGFGKQFSGVMKGRKIPSMDASVIPTSLLQGAIGKLILSYPQLLSQSYRSDREKIITSIGRWGVDKVDTHDQKMDFLDGSVWGNEKVAGIMTRANTLLESAIVDTVKKNKYAVPFPLFEKVTKGAGKSSPLVAEGMYYGKNARDLTGFQELSVYRGSYRNLTGLQQDTVSHGNIQGSVGSSYGIFDTEVEANRLYNTDLIRSDSDRMKKLLDEDDMKDNDKREKFMKYYRGNNTPLNLTTGAQGGLVVKNAYNVQGSWDPLSDPIWGGGSIFDRAGSKRTSKVHSDSSSFLDANNVSVQATNTLVPYSYRSRGKLHRGTKIVDMHYQDDNRYSGRQSRLNVDFFSVRPKGGTFPISINGDVWDTSLQVVVNGVRREKPGFNPILSDYFSYHYKLLDSTVINASPTPQQIAKMNRMTPDRPIDSDHNVTFQGLGGGVVKLVMPNVRDVPVFSREGSLQDVSVIRDTIKTYLRDTIRDYNTILTEQNELGSKRYVSYTGAYNFLGSIDPLASVNRTYQLLPGDFLVTVLGEKYIQRVARALWWQNLPRKQLQRSSIVKKDLETIGQSAYIDYKIAEVVNSYLHEDSDTSLLPTYRPRGYEAVALHSNTNSTNLLGIDSPWGVADDIKKAQQKASSAFGSSGSLSVSDELSIEEAGKCGYVGGEAVPLLGDWLDALNCRWEQTQKKVFDVKIFLPNIKARGESTWGNFVTSWKQFGKHFQKQQDSQQVVAEAVASEKDDNEKVFADLDPTERALLLDAYRSFHLEWSDDSAMVDDLDDLSVKTWINRDDVSGLSFSLTSTGAQCVVIDGTNTCQSPYVIANLSKERKILVPRFSSLQAGSAALQAKICIKGTDACAIKTVPFELLPGRLNSATFHFSSTKIAQGSLLPVSVQALDKGKNVVGMQAIPLQAKAKQGMFEYGGAKNTTKDIYDPMQTLWHYRAPSRAGKAVVDTLTLTNTGADGVISYDTKSIVSVPAKIDAVVVHEGKRGNTMDISLDSSMMRKNRNNLPQLTIVARDDQGSPLAYQYMTVSTDPAGALLVNEKGKSRNIRQTDKNGVLKVGVSPAFALGQSKIYIAFYGSDKGKEVVINWKPGTPAKVTIDSNIAELSPKETTTATVNVFDKRGNRIDYKKVRIKLAINGPVSFSNGQNSMVVSPSSTVSLTTTREGKATMIALVDGVETMVGDTRSWTVSQDLLKMDKLNTMTLLLDGQGRGDWSSQGSGHRLLPQMFVSSRKLLAMGTTITSPSLIGSGQYVAPRSSDSFPGPTLANVAQADATPLTDWAQGSTRGRAHQVYGNPLTVVFGDPLVRHLDDDKKDAKRYNTQRGERIFTDPNKVVRQSLPIDFNNDGLEDLVVLHEDGSINLLKNYGGKSDPYVNMGLLLLVADPVREMYVGDVDGNGFDDIIVQLKNGQLRAYSNDKGIFDVDGYPLCIKIGEDISGMDYGKNIRQIFFYDMDKDGSMDIVTNDIFGVVKITYGGSSSYLSRDRVKCDAGWEGRIREDQTIVTEVGVKLSDGPISDGSLVHWKGLVNDGISQASSDSLDKAQNIRLPKKPKKWQINNGIKQATDINTDELMAQYAVDAFRFSPSPVRFAPQYYGDTKKYHDMVYVPLYSHRDTDPVTIEKTFTDHNGGRLLPGDRVTVTVRATAREDTMLTYFDDGRGSRKVTKQTDRIHKAVGPVLSGFDWKDLSDVGIVYKDAPSSSYLYMLDNVPFSAGQMREWSYDIIYEANPLVTIDVRDFNQDSYRDIIIKPTDGCQKRRQERTNTTLGKKRSYVGHTTDLGKIEKSYTEKQEAKDPKGKTVAEIQGAIDNEDPNGVSAMNKAYETRSEDFFSQYGQGSTFWEKVENGINNGNSLSANIDLDIAVDPAIMDAYKKATQGLCQGFKVGKGCGGLPVPFNMAFLSPGNLSVMGCKVFEDKGLPIASFPTNAFPFVRPPNPAGAGGRFGKGPSFIRGYVSPTLTQQVGGAICFGPEGVTSWIPSPFNNIVGNCLVTAIAADSKCDSDVDADVRPDGEDSLNQNYYDLSQGDSCSNEAAQVTKALENPPVTSPFVGVDSPSWSVGSNGVSSPSLGSGPLLGGLFYLQKDPITLSSENVTTDTVSLVPGKDVKNTIKGGNGGGFAQCLIQGWLDPQITYIVNNLTTLGVTVYLPDLSSITQGFGDLSADNLKKLWQDTKKENKKNQTRAIDKKDTTTLKKAVTGSRNEKLINLIGIQRAHMEGLDGKLGLNNPFTMLEKVFKEIPLINISKRKVPITIPMVTDEELTAYESSLHEWINHNKTIVQSWGDSISAVVGVCGQVADFEDVGNMTAEDFKAKSKEIITKLKQTQTQELHTDKARLANACMDVFASGKLDAMITFKTDMAAIMQVVQANIQAVRTYKEFPSQLQKMLRSIDRYVSDLATFISGFFGRINERLGTNARIFNGYVDAIIAMKAAVTTWQAIIDLSVDWKKSCGTCANENYGSYSCNLKGLCPDLPLLPFPPQKIPHIYVDLSHIDAGMDIVLPEIAFVSKSVTLPTLPNLPEPPVIEVDLQGGKLGSLGIEATLSFMKSLFDANAGSISGLPSLPNMPTLPPAPTLPSLPPLIPKVDMSLPYLPPPPKIPSLSPKIQLVIDKLKLISKLYCMMKGEIGLVDESTVKAKVEQLTQRKRNVPLFDYFNLNMKFDAPTLQGVDFLVESKVDFTMNVDHIYAILDSIAKVSNGLVDDMIMSANTVSQDAVNNTSKAVNKTVNDAKESFNEHVNDVKDKVKKAADTVSDVVKDAVDKVQKTIDKNVNGATDAAEKGVNDVIHKVKKTVSYQSGSVDISVPQVNRNDMLAMVASVQEQQYTPSRDLTQLTKVIRDRQSDPVLVEYDYAAIQKQQNDVLVALGDYQRRVASVSTMNDVLALVDMSSAIGPQEVKMVASMKVPSRLDYVKGLNPGQDYLVQQQKFLAGYEKSLKQFSPRDVRLTKQSYESLAQKIAQTKVLASRALTNMKYYNKPRSPRGQVAAKDVSVSKKMGYDYGQYLKGTYMLSGNVSYDVLASDYREEQIQGHQQTDLNHDGVDDLLWWDSHSVYVKYGYLNNMYKPYVDEGKGDVRYIDLGKGRKNVDEDGSYRLGRGRRIRVGSMLPAAQSVKAQGQSFDSVVLTWKDSASYDWKPAGYLVRMVQRADVHQDSAHRDVRQPDLRDQYVMVIAIDQPVPDLIRLERGWSYQKTQDLIDEGVLIVKRASLPSQSVSIALEDLSRNWHYSQVAHLSADNLDDSSDITRMTISSPWSKQGVVGPQIIGDDNPPEPEVTLLRERLNGKVVGSGLSLDANIGTYYTLAVKWSDPSGVEKNRIRRPDGVSRSYSGDTASWTGLFFTGLDSYQIQIGANDTQDNKGESMVMLKLSSPEIKIVTVTTGTNNGSIVARLSHDIDEGRVQFSRKGGSSMRSVLSGTDGVSYPVTTLQTVITGGLYTIGDGVTFSDNDGSAIGAFDPHTGEMSAQSSYHIVGQWQDHTLRWDIQDKTGKSRFSVSLPIESVEDKKVINPAYERKDPEIDGIVSCLVYENNCIVAENDNHQLFVPAPYNYLYRATYSYDKETKQITIGIVREGNEKPVAEVVVKALDLLSSS